MHETWTDRLSDYIDHDLTEVERKAVEAHLDECAACREVLRDLQAVVGIAHTNPVTGPDRDLWPAIQPQLSPAVRTQPALLSWPAAMAAGLFLGVASSLGVWAVANRDTVAPVEHTATRTDGSEPMMVPVSVSYEGAVGDLVQVLSTRRARLNPRTVEIVERNIAIIDRAIAQARAALERDPGDVELASHLAHQQRTKLALLRQVEKLTEEQ